MRSGRMAGVRRPLLAGEGAGIRRLRARHDRNADRLVGRQILARELLDHFFENGFDGTTMSAIAAQLGGSKRTLWSYFASTEELFVAVIEDRTASVRGGMDFSGLGDTPLDQLTNLARSVIERMVSPLAVRMYRLVSSLSDRHPELVRTFFDRGPSRTRGKIGDYLRDNFADILWADNFMTAGDDLVGLATAHFHFQSLWGIAAPPTPKQKDARARLAAMLFLRAYGRDPDVLVPREVLAETEAMLAAA